MDCTPSRTAYFCSFFPPVMNVTAGFQVILKQVLKEVGERDVTSIFIWTSIFFNEKLQIMYLYSNDFHWQS